ncbi:unnamed protein product [Linum trigynum]|uniref:Uncharacterized protein n=1 Tax=Linum trigynum TaxID=586398 RepID=A0AAV2CW17_9ROSI
MRHERRVRDAKPCPKMTRETRRKVVGRSPESRRKWPAMEAAKDGGNGRQQRTAAGAAAGGGGRLSTSTKEERGERK